MLHDTFSKAVRINVNDFSHHLVKSPHHFSTLAGFDTVEPAIYETCHKRHPVYYGKIWIPPCGNNSV